MKKISAIIVNWNDKQFTAECIDSLLKQTYPELEIIVSDNGSTDGSLPFLRERYPTVRLLDNGENLGFGRAVNRGLAVATGDLFIFLNNDLVVGESSLGELVRLLESDSSIGAAIPKILFCEKRDTLNSFGVQVHFTGMAYPYLLEQKDRPDLETQETACGGIFMFSRELYETIGGFDDDFFLYHEDHDLSWRIRLQGKKLMVCPQAEFFHHYKFNKGTFKFYSSEKNRLHLLAKHLEPGTMLLIAPALLLVEMAQWGHAALNGWFVLKMKSYWDLFPLLPRILKKRRAIRRQRKVPDREIVRLFEGKLELSGMNHPLLKNILSPLLERYWSWIRPWI